MNKFDQLCELIKFYKEESSEETRKILDKILQDSSQIETIRRYGKYTSGEYEGSKDGVHSKEKNLWSKVMERCNPGVVWKIRPTYQGCSASENFKDFQFFAKWCNEQVGFKNKNWHLDKDLLVKGNKVYSENTCVFLPQQLNSLIVTRKSQRGKWPIGVYKRPNSKTFMVQCNNAEGKLCQFHGFKDEFSAFEKYKEFKESVIKQQAEKWKDQIDPRAYDALMNYTVEITD